MYRPLILSLLFLVFSCEGFALKSRPKAILFDVFGTCVDFRGSLILQGMKFNQTSAKQYDWEVIADQWVKSHSQSIEEIRTGNAPWKSLDEIHLEGLRDLLEETPETLSELNQFWHRLSAWPDVKPALQLLQQSFFLAAFSNANLQLLKDLTYYNNFPWKIFVSAEEVQHYKPDPEIYLFAVEKLKLKPNEILLVASHAFDLRAARAIGMQTAYILRPNEFGNIRRTERVFGSEFDYVASDFLDLAVQLKNK